ncbi:MAG: HPF/RaiA family ribosome-associated protein [Candidatus Pacearchaeota archaeon]|jgi:ribosome-associated translation inhibitor RaiA
MVELQTIGFEILTDNTRNEFEKIFEENSKKIDRMLGDAESFRVRLKEHSKGGKTKFSIHALVTYAGKTMDAEASDFDLRKVFHMVFKKIEQQIEHEFHISNQNKRR